MVSVLQPSDAKACSYWHQHERSTLGYALAWLLLPESGAAAETSVVSVAGRKGHERSQRSGLSLAVPSRGLHLFCGAQQGAALRKAAVCKLQRGSGVLLASLLVLP